MSASKKLKIDFVCAGDPLDIHTWSGTPFHMLQALGKEFDLGLVIRKPWRPGFPFFRRLIRRLSLGKIDLFWSRAWTRFGAGPTVEQLKRSDSDMVFVVAATPICALLTGTNKTVFVSDATQSAMVNYNPRHNALSANLKASAAELETTSISGSIAAFFPSRWAQASAIKDHAAAPDRAFQVPWGANLPSVDIKPPEERSLDEWRILFVGVDWVGKGGDIALKTAELLRDRGCRVHLDIAGCVPSTPPPTIEGVTFHGFLNKNVEADRDRLTGLFQNAHILMLPTQFEALGVVVAEAASFGVPSISYDTGGVSGNFDPGKTGILLDTSAGPAEFANEINALLSDRARYIDMAHAAADYSQRRLNWPAWAHEVATLLRQQWQSERQREWGEQAC
ncbi:glycosyltransferase family 4 protein [Novosphingobium sp. G106]|uniref:glycosyltransferase family 4 protein n=1 Tax=Novosphingobium sp. G106 TaxID=2849500 RepID=UPI001C2DE02F|nr:glycosyltransferase family 4 protein [Novosphingobium sp. G106]MBV1692166.1 glycosyltransferase family 4 protein [Novosphingobium sp. G106]